MNHLIVFLVLLLAASLISGFIPAAPKINAYRASSERKSFLDDIFANNAEDQKDNEKENQISDESVDGIDLDMSAFKARKEEVETTASKIGDDFDGYAMRDVILEKWGVCYDIDFNKVSSFGFRELYLNVYPFHLGGRRFRHDSELDYLCHLQAVVEILQKYDRLESVIYEIQTTNKKPKMGAPLKAVPIRLDLSEEDVNKIIGY